MRVIGDFFFFSSVLDLKNASELFISPYDVISLNIFERLFWTNISFLSLIVEKEISYVDSKFEIGETGNHLMNLLFNTHF